MMSLVVSKFVLPFPTWCIGGIWGSVVSVLEHFPTNFQDNHDSGISSIQYIFIDINSLHGTSCMQRAKIFCIIICLKIAIRLNLLEYNHS